MQAKAGSSTTLVLGRGVRANWLGEAVLKLDEGLRRSHGVFEYSQDEACLFRIRLGAAPVPLRLAGVSVGAGEPVVELHFWNEHIQPIHRFRSGLRWAAHVQHSVTSSFRDLVAFLDSEPRFSGVRAIYANMGLGDSERTSQLTRMCRLAGFEDVPAPRPVAAMERLHRLGENMLGLLLALAVNPSSARLSILTRDRALIAMSRDDLRRRYGGA